MHSNCIHGQLLDNILLTSPSMLGKDPRTAWSWSVQVRNFSGVTNSGPWVSDPEIWSFDALYSITLEWQYGSAHRSLSLAGKVKPSSVQSEDRMIVCPFISDYILVLISVLHSRLIIAIPPDSENMHSTWYEFKARFGRILNVPFVLVPRSKYSWHVDG